MGKLLGSLASLLIATGFLGARIYTDFRTKAEAKYEFFADADNNGHLSDKERKESTTRFAAANTRKD